MSAKQTVQEFLEASAQDAGHARHLLADDLVWEFNGVVQTTSADEFVARQRADTESASVQTDVDVLVGDDKEVVAIGWFSFTPDGEDRATMRMRTAEYFRLAGGRIVGIKDVFAAA